jgi:hypothetical protein
MVVGIISDLNVILAAPQLWFNTLTLSVVTDIRYCFALKIYKINLRFL